MGTLNWYNFSLFHSNRFLFCCCCCCSKFNLWWKFAQKNVNCGTLRRAQKQLLEWDCHNTQNHLNCFLEIRTKEIPTQRSGNTPVFVLHSKHNYEFKKCSTINCIKTFFARFFLHFGHLVYFVAPRRDGKKQEIRSRISAYRNSERSNAWWSFIPLKHITRARVCVCVFGIFEIGEMAFCKNMRTYWNCSWLLLLDFVDN